MSLVPSTDPAAMERSGMVRMYADEAYAYANKLIKDWQPNRDTFFLRNGDWFMIGLAAIPGLLVTTKVQNVNKIFAMGGRKFPVVFIATVIPAATTFGLAGILQRDIFLQITSCPVCLEVRGITFQMLGGVAVPTFLATAGVNQVMHATDRSTISPFSKEFFKWYGKMFYKCRYIMFANGCVQAAAVSLLLMAWSKEWRYINYELERRAKEDEERKLEMKVEEILETTRE